MPSPEGYRSSQAAEFKAGKPNSPELNHPKSVNNNYPETAQKDSVVPFNSSPQRVGVGKTEYMPDGAQIIVLRKPVVPSKPRPKVSQTAEFEARHAVLGLASLQEVSIVPGPGYKGITRFSRYEPVAAAAHVHEGGGDYDAMIIRLMGDDVNTMASLAKSKINEKRKDIDAVAEALMEENTLTKEGVNRVIFSASQERQKKLEKERNKHLADIFIRSPDGSVKKMQNIFAPEGVIYDPVRQILAA